MFVHMQKQLSENVFIDERRPVLLCDGKLCLRALQDLFNLTIVEMMYGMWILLMSHFESNWHTLHHIHYLATSFVLKVGKEPKIALS